VPLAIGTSSPSEDTESLTPPDGAAVGALAVAISLGIALQERYTRDNFVKYARSHLTDEYVTISALNLFRFEQRTYMDENQQPLEAMLLYVGRWFYSKSGGSQTWALATPSGIEYYSGKHESMCKPVQNLHLTRIYHDYPFDRMFVTQGLHGPARDQTQTV
jgi:hypothetical protein